MTLAICFGGLALCGFALVLLYGHELRRMARFLRNRDGRSNSRLTTEMPGPGFADLARAVNGTLDAADRRERERAAEQRQFQRDLASLSHDIRTPLMGAKGYVSLAAEEPDDARPRPLPAGSRSAPGRHGGPAGRAVRLRPRHRCRVRSG